MPSRVKKGTNRAMAQPYLEAFAAQGLSANQALGRLRELGLGYRRQTFLDDYRTYTGREKAKDVAKYIRKDYYPTDAVMTPDVRNLKTKYQSLVKFTLQNVDTGEVFTKDFYLAHDEQMTIGRIESTMANVVASRADMYKVAILDYGYRGTRYRID